MGGLVAVLALSSCSPALPSCDNERIQSGLRNAISARPQLSGATLSNIATASRSGSAAVCTAHLATASGIEANITYSLALRGNEAHFEVTRVDQDLARCDSPQIQTGIRNGIANSTGQTITAMTNIATTSRTATAAACTAHITAAGGAEADIVYSLTKAANGDTNFAVTNLTQTSGGAHEADRQAERGQADGSQGEQSPPPE